MFPIHCAVMGGSVELVQWLVDKKTGAFYGSCIVQMASPEVAQAATQKPLKVDQKKIKVSLAHAKPGDEWPPANVSDREFPPLGS